MANLTTKELGALEDQLGFEKVMCCKYQEAMQQCEIDGTRRGETLSVAEFAALSDAIGQRIEN